MKKLTSELRIQSKVKNVSYDNVISDWLNNEIIKRNEESTSSAVNFNECKDFTSIFRLIFESSTTNTWSPFGPPSVERPPRTDDKELW